MSPWRRIRRPLTPFVGRCFSCLLLVRVQSGLDSPCGSQPVLTPFTVPLSIIPLSSAIFISTMKVSDQNNRYFDNNWKDKVYHLLDVNPCNLVDKYTHFGGTCCLHLQARQKWRQQIPPKHDMSNSRRRLSCMSTPWELQISTEGYLHEINLLQGQ
jgi:hypothetical protein